MTGSITLAVGPPLTVLAIAFGLWANAVAAFRPLPALASSNMESSLASIKKDIYEIGQGICVNRKLCG